MKAGGLVKYNGDERMSYLHKGGRLAKAASIDLSLAAASRALVFDLEAA
jgi:hypothetical protein